jgi:hypothetical protein
MRGRTSQLILRHMGELTKLSADAHIQDLRRNAERAAGASVRRRRRDGIDVPITIRRATEADAAGLARLAALDSAAVPVAPVLVAESNGELRAALSLNDGETVADPFHPTAPIVELLVTFAAEGRDGRRTLPGGRRGRRSTRRAGLAATIRRARLT